MPLLFSRIKCVRKQLVAYIINTLVPAFFGVMLSLETCILSLSTILNKWLSKFLLEVFAVRQVEISPPESGWLRKRFGMTEQLLLSCYKTYVIPIVMYGCPVWHPSLTEKDRSQLETIQTRACKIILGSNYKNYEESLSELRLPTLDERRHETLMKFGADILKSPTHRDILPRFTSVTHAHKTRVATFKEGKELLECPPTHSTTRFLNSFVPYFVKQYNDNILKSKW